MKNPAAAAEARPLAGVRVFDLCRLLPGPACTWYLQGLGAEIIRLEEPGLGDWMRHVPPFLPDGVGAWYAAVNAGKKSIALDLKREPDRQALLGLLPTTDVVVEGFRPGVLARLGLDPVDLTRHFPHLIIASITGFGQTGPWAQAAGHDLGYCALAGALSLGRRHGGVPDLPGLPVADLCGGALTGALQVAAALFARERTGRGRWLDVSMTEGVLALVGPAVAQWSASGRRPVPGGEALTGGVASYGLYRCADDRVLAFAPLEAKFWQAFERVVARVEPGLAVLPDATALRALFATRPRDEWVERLSESCAEAMLELDEVVDHPLHRARRSVVDTPWGPRVRPPFPGAEVDVALPTARLGEHTAEILLAAGIDPAPFVEVP